MKVLKVMFSDGRIVAYLSKDPSVVAAQMIEMSADEFAAQYADPDKPDVNRLFRNEGHLRNESLVDRHMTP